MKKLCYAICIVVFAACGGSKPADDKVADIAPAQEKASMLSEAFNASFGKLLHEYYALRDALTADDTAAANTAAASLITAAAGVKLDELKAVDTSNIIIPTAKTYTDGISAESKGLIGESKIGEKRKAFQMISAGLFDLVRTVRYDKEKIYLLHCPMAFNNTGADWLSNATEIKNPYFGKDMRTCGEVRDSVVFR